MSLFRTALSLGLLLLGIQAQKLHTKSHRKHHKHHKVLLSHGRSRYEIVEPSADKDPVIASMDKGLVNLAAEEKQTPEYYARSKQLAQYHQRMMNYARQDVAHKSDVKPAKKLEAHEDKDAKTEPQPPEKQAQNLARYRAHMDSYMKGSKKLGQHQDHDEKNIEDARTEQQPRKTEGQDETRFDYGTELAKKLGTSQEIVTEDDDETNIKDAKKEEQPLAKAFKKLDNYEARMVEDDDETNIKDAEKGWQPLANMDSYKKASKTLGTYEVRIAEERDEKNSKDAPTEPEPLEKEAQDQTPIDSDRKPTKNHQNDQEDHTELTMAKAAEGLKDIRQEIRFAKKKKHQIQVLKQSLAAQQKLLDESSDLELAAKEDDESEEMVQSQVHELETMRSKIRKLIASNAAQANKASHQATEEAKALREAATLAEKAAEEALSQSKKIKEKAAKLEKIANKQLGTMETDKQEMEKQAQAAPLAQD